MERRRLVIVRRGALELFDTLRKRYAEDLGTCVMWDRRAGDRRRDETEGLALNRRRRERRQPMDPAILVERGFFVTFARRTPNHAARALSN
jgi:hypothetical protein